MDFQLPMFEPSTTWKVPNPATLPSWAGAKRVAIDTETKDPRLKEYGIGVRHDGQMIGVSFAIEDGPAHYLPFGHLGGDNMDREVVMRYLRDQASVFTETLVGANLPYDLDYLEQNGVHFKPKWHRDVQVAAPLCNELETSYSLENIGQRLGLGGKDETQLSLAAEAYGVNHKKGLWQLPARHVGAYAEHDARLPLAILRRQELTIEEEDLWKVYDLESRLLPVLLRMRRRGVKVSMDRLDQVERFCLEQERIALAEVTRLTGVRLSETDTTKPKRLEPALQFLGIEVPRAPAGKLPSVKNEWLRTIDHPVAGLLLRAKAMNKVRTTFVVSVREYAVNGRIHCTLNQTRQPREGQDDEENGALYGRLSCVDPNLQQQPARDPELGPMWRSIYLPDTDRWLCADYSQQEPRWLTHFAALCGYTGAVGARQRYIDDPSTDNHQMMSDLTGVERKKAKEIYLGLCYGMGSAKMARKCGLPTKWIMSKRTGKMIEVAGDEAQAILDRFNSGAPYVSQLAKGAEAVAQKRGYILTVAGRRCRFPKRAELGPKGEKYDWTYKGGNRLIQGSSGDQTKTAMVAADAEGIPLQLQVHDELDLSIVEDKEAHDLSTIMRECVPCTVPAKVDLEVGPSWGELEKL